MSTIAEQLHKVNLVII